MLKICRIRGTRYAFLVCLMLMSIALAQVKPRARDLGIPFDARRIHDCD